MPLLRCREQASDQQQQRQQQQLAGGCYADIEQLQSHWDQLDGARKVMYAQMALLTRYCGVQQSHKACHLHLLQPALILFDCKTLGAPREDRDGHC